MRQVKLDHNLVEDQLEQALPLKDQTIHLPPFNPQAEQGTEHHHTGQGLLVPLVRLLAPYIPPPDQILQILAHPLITLLRLDRLVFR